MSVSMPRHGIQEDENSPGRYRDTHACHGYFQSSSFFPGARSRSRLVAAIQEPFRDDVIRTPSEMDGTVLPGSQCSRAG